MLEQLLDNYSDSRQIPTDTPMDEDTYDDLVDDDSSKGEKIVKNADDMKDIFHDAYDNTLETVQFKVDGYTITGKIFSMCTHNYRGKIHTMSVV